MTRRASLKHVSTTALKDLRDALASGVLRTPVDRASLLGFGIRHQIETIEGALGGHRTSACLAVLDVALAEREDPRPAPELVWTGPEAPGGAARDTAIVLRALFEGARQSVILAGYRFDHANDVLAPLHASMRDHQVSAVFFVDIPKIEGDRSEEAHLDHCLGGFLKQNWPFGDPRPRLYYDKRALDRRAPYASLHAKCVVVDGEKAFLSSANFTQRGQERNIEAGVLVHDPRFATYLAQQWTGLIEADFAREYTRP